MKTRNVIVIGALLALGAVSLAQDPGGQGQPRGQGRGRGGMMRGGMMRGGPTMLLQRDDVQAELKLTAEQKNKLTELRDKTREQMRSAMMEAQGDRTAMQEIFRKMGQQTQQAVDVILTPEQRVRLKQLAIQRAGSSAVLDPNIQKELALTPDQIKRINDLNAKLEEANRSVFERARSGEIQREEVRTTMEKNRTTLGTEIDKVLTAAQRAKLKEMAGAPFAFKEEDGPGGR